MGLVWFWNVNNFEKTTSSSFRRQCLCGWKAIGVLETLFVVCFYVSRTYLCDLYCACVLLITSTSAWLEACITWGITWPLLYPRFLIHQKQIQEREFLPSATYIFLGLLVQNHPFVCPSILLPLAIGQRLLLSLNVALLLAFRVMSAPCSIVFLYHFAVPRISSVL